MDKKDITVNEKEQTGKLRSNSQEAIVLAIVHRERGEAYGRSVRDELEAIEGRSFALTTIYTILQRLEEKGFVETSLTEPLPERGGRRKQLFRITGSGVQALTEAQVNTERRQAALAALKPNHGGS